MYETAETLQEHASPSAASVPPYIDGVTGIARNGTKWEGDPALWNRTASVMVRGSAYGETVARIKVRMEGKGDPVGVQVPQQTMFVYDDSGSMTWSDPNNLRCAAMSSYIDMLSLPSEIGTVRFESTATMLHPLTTDYAGVKASLSCMSSGGTDIHDGLRLANDELIAKNKSGYAWAEIMLTDGVWNQGGDPRPEVDRATLNRIRIFTICLGGQCNLQDLQLWANLTGGKFYDVQNASDLAQVYTDIAGWLSTFSGSAPASGEPMVVFKLNDDIEVVPGSFRCDSVGCVDPRPNNSAAIVDGNRGIRLEWFKPMDEMFLGRVWQIELGVRSYVVGNRTRVNDPLASHIAYDRYDRTPGGDALEQLYLDSLLAISPRVIWTSPSDGMAGVPYDWPVEVRFDMTMDQSTTAGSFSITPPVAGSTSTGPDSIHFDHPGNFTAGTRYDITISDLARSALGVPMMAPYRFSFNTTPAPLPPKVVATDPSDAATDVPIGHTVTVVFDQAMEPSSTAAAFSSDRPIPGSNVSVNGRELQWTHGSPFAPFATYNLRIAGSATSVAGVAMGNAYLFHFTTGGTPWVPRVVSTDPHRGEADVERDRPVQV
ncbi:MAG TPA: Ig-like domain-containing protein, partial [Thermoplasmata archaeon]|nr:Ig-like domain-containing protein [Thermoplasmata archaeon]